jgi:hypothetical protein
MYQYTSVDRIYNRLNRSGVSFNEEDVIDMIGEALGLIGTPRMMEEAVAFYEVKNYQCPVPPNCQGILQLARNNNWTATHKVPCPYEPIKEEPNIFYQTCSTCGGEPTGVDLGYVVLDGKGSPLVEYDVAYYRPYFDLLGEYYGWSNCGHYHRNYTPIRLANHSFFNSVVSKEYDGSLYSASRDEYTLIDQNRQFRFNFPCGFVAIAHNRNVLDKNTGYPMIPDNESHILAIVNYIKMNKSDYDFFAHREGSDSRLQKYENDWQWYCAQAKASDKMPQTVDELQNLHDQRNYFLPHENVYNNFFGNLSRAEYRKYNDPSLRNYGTNYRYG